MIDLIPYVNSELAALKIGAHPLNFLQPGKNPVRCDDKKFKGSVVVYLNESNGKITNFSIYSPKHGGVKSRTVKIRDILNRGYEPREATRQEIESLRRESEQRKIAKKQAIEQARRRAIDDYRRAVESGTSGYFERKQVKPAPGIKFDSTTAIIPVCRFKQSTNELKVVAIQRIDENGQKLFNKNAEISGGFFPIGNRENPQQIYFCEGVATGLSIHQSLDNPNDLVIACFNTGNMPQVIEEFASRYPQQLENNQFVLCADNDRWKSSNAGFLAAHKVVSSYPQISVTFPFFLASEQNFYKTQQVDNPTDFNDAYILQGIDAIAFTLQHEQLSARQFLEIVQVFKDNQNREVCISTEEKQANMLERLRKIRGDNLDASFFHEPPVDINDSAKVHDFIKQNSNRLTPNLHSNWISAVYRVNKPFLSDDEYIKIIQKERDDRPLVLIVKSCTGSNKTGAVVSLSLHECNTTAIAVLPRIALEKNSNHRFNTTPDGKINNFQSYDYAGVDSDRVTTVVNSIGRFSQKEMIIADEFTQIQRHLTRIDAKDKPLKIAQAYEKQLKNAVSVINMDAHITDADLVRTRQQIPQNAKVVLLINDYKKTHVGNRRRVVRVHPFVGANQKNSGRGYVLNQLEFFLAKERAVFATNMKDSSKRDLDEIAARRGLKSLQQVASENGMTALNYVESHGLKDVGYVFISQDNVGDFAPILRAGGEWKEVLKDVWLFGFTPILGTGIDFSKTDFRKGFGIFSSNTTTSRDIVQQLNRFRDLFDLDIAVESKNYRLPESPVEIIEKSNYLAEVHSSEIRKLNISMQVAGVDLMPYRLSPIEIMHAEIEASDNADKNNLLKSLEFWLEHEGYQIEVTTEQGQFESAGDAKIRAENERVQAILTAPSIDNDVDFESLQKKSCTESETYSKERYKIERFYDEPISTELIEFDDHGKKRVEIRNQRLMTAPIESIQETTVKEYVDIQDIGLKNLQLLTTKRQIFEAIYRTARLFTFNNVIYSLESTEDFELLLQNVRDFQETQLIELGKLANLKKSEIGNAISVLENPAISQQDIAMLVDRLLDGKRAKSKKTTRIKNILLSMKGFSVYGVLWQVAQLTGANNVIVKRAEKLIEHNIVEAVTLLSNGIMPRQKSEILSELKTHFSSVEFANLAKSINVLRDGLPRFEHDFLNDDKKLWLYYKNMLGLHGILLTSESAKRDLKWSKIYSSNIETIRANRPYLLKKIE